MSYGAADPSAIGGPFVQKAKKSDGLPAHGSDWKPVWRSDADTVAALPLTALLSQALMAFTIDYEDAFPWPLASTLTVLSHLSAEPQLLSEVPEPHGITGNGKSLLERHLIIKVSRDPATGQRFVALTDRGIAVMHHHPGRLEAVEAAWTERFGRTVVSDLRDALVPPTTRAAGQPNHVITSNLT